MRAFCDLHRVARTAAGLRRRWRRLDASSKFRDEQVTSARLGRGQSLAAAIDASLFRSSAGASLACMAAMAVALGFSAPVEAASTFTVTTTADPAGAPGTLSLRQAITAANASDNNTVQFDPSLANSTITLSAGEIAIQKRMYVIGLGADRTTISGNDASDIFAVACPSAQVFIEHMRLTHGKAVLGGALNVSNHCALNLRYSEVTDSQASILGGGVYASDSNVQITRSSITGNSAGQAGGGVSSYGGFVSVLDSTISGNQATYMGAGLYITRTSYLDLYSSTISGNSIPVISGPYSKPVGGAGVLVAGSKIYARNATIAYNYAFGGGGGIRFNDAYSSSHAKIYSSTIANNSTCCYDGGNGILSIGATTKFTLTIVANNFNRGGNDDLAGSFDAYKSLVRDTGSATIFGTNSKFGADPLLGKLGVNGGSTLTMLPAGGSPALDAAGTCSDETTLYDQRGVSRCFNGHVDMGAVERQSPEIIIFRNGFDPGG